MPILKDLNLNLLNDDYTNAKDRFIELCCDAGITKEKIGFFGNVGFPGISDLDAFVCDIPERLIQLERLHKNELEKSPNYKYIYWHTPVLLPDLAIEYTSFLHTLHGLVFQANGLKICKPTVQNSEILNMVWFLSLIRRVISIKKHYLNKKPTSLRLLLLVYKNLEYSHNVFSGKANSDQNIMPADNLREHVKLRYDDLNSSIDHTVYHNFFNIIEASFSSFDNYCRNSSVFKNELSKYSNQSYAFLSLSLICRKNNKGSSVKIRGRIAIIDLNPHAFLLVVNLINNYSNDQSINNYIKSLNGCKAICNSHNIGFPFIDVASKPAILFNRIILRILNNIVSFL